MLGFGHSRKTGVGEEELVRALEAEKPKTFLGKKNAEKRKGELRNTT